MPKRISSVLLTLLLLVAVAAVTPSATAHDPTPRRATLGTFARYWWGHARRAEWIVPSPPSPDCYAVCATGRSAIAAGRSTTNVEPKPSADWTVSRPSIRRTSSRQM
jgi:hypothetical protein